MKRISRLDTVAITMLAAVVCFGACAVAFSFAESGPQVVGPKDASQIYGACTANAKCDLGTSCEKDCGSGDCGWIYRPVHVGGIVKLTSTKCKDDDECNYNEPGTENCY